jgi:hypothetical protein
METDPVSETLFSSYLEFRTMDKVLKPSDPEWYTTVRDLYILVVWKLFRLLGLLVLFKLWTFLTSYRMTEGCGPEFN